MLVSELKFLPVSSAMTANPISVFKNSPLTVVFDLFQNNNIHHIPVLDEEGYVTGIISKSDILLLLDWGTKLKLPQSEDRNNWLMASNLAEDICQKRPITVKETDTLQYCVDIFIQNYFRSLPVVDDAGKLKGIITPFDLMLLAFTDVKNKI